LTIDRTLNSGFKIGRHPTSNTSNCTMHRAEACTADGRGLTRSCVRPESLQAQGGGSRAAALRHGAAQSGLKACPPAASARQLQQLQQFEYHLCMQLLSSPREVQFWRPTRVMEALPAGSAEAAAGRGNGGLEISGKQAGRPSSQPAQSRAGGAGGQFRTLSWPAVWHWATCELPVLQTLWPACRWAHPYQSA
jgi:hypothetical protein